ncbi:MAG: hypothetical protein ACI9IO_001521 [Cyanobium sp.]|jgi:hypothetical protein
MFSGAGGEGEQDAVQATGTMISEQMFAPVLRLRPGELLRLAAHGDPRSGITTGCPAVAKRAVWRQR